MSFTKIALVTGGSKGIGAATAVALAKAGWEAIAINYSSDTAGAEQIIAEIHQSTSAKAKAFKADISTVAACDKLVADVVAQFGGLTLVVHSAGIMKLKPILANSEADFDMHFNLNVKAPFFLSKAVIPHLKPDVGGLIFVSSSQTADSATRPPYIVYNSTKGAVEQISRSLAKELGTKGIRVNTVSPGPTNTALFLEGKSEAMVKGIAGNSPFNRLGESEEIANVITFVASDKASWLSGQNLRVNGAIIV